MEEVFHGPIWYAILRVAASRWKKGDWYGPLARVFFNMLTLERHRELWHYDTDGRLRW